jgi:hypothetical protein
MNLWRVTGWAVGVLVLAASFFLPYWDLTSGPGQMATLFGSAMFVVYNAGSLVGSGLVGDLSIVILFGAALVILSGVLGAFPREAGVLGVVAMLMLTLSPLLLFPGLGFGLGDFGVGYWTIWGLSVFNLIVGVALTRSPVEAEIVPPPSSPPAVTA